MSSNLHLRSFSKNRYDSTPFLPTGRFLSALKKLSITIILASTVHDWNLAVKNRLSVFERRFDDSKCLVNQ